MADLLLVDDEPDQLELRKLLLERAGYAVRTAHSAEAAIRAATERPPAVTVMDLRLPDAKDGLRLIRQLNELSVRIIVLSGWPSDLEYTPEHPLVFRLFPKPVNLSVLLEAIQEASAPYKFDS